MSRPVYFIGIGGIGMSALARFFRHEGALVAGYDRTPSDLTAALEREGIAITFADDPATLPAAFRDAPDLLVVRTPAVPEDSAITRYFRDRGVPMLKRSEVLGALTADRPTLAVAGTHGKTTTTAWLAHLLDGTPGGCTAFLGGIAAASGTNLHLRAGAPWTVVEADEYDRSFLHLHPTHAAVTSVDPDHLDIYGTAESFREGFEAFAARVTGRLLVHADVPQDAFPGKAVERYGTAVDEADRVQRGLLHAAVGPRLADGGRTRADLVLDGERVAEGVLFAMPGEHNLANAVAAAGLARAAGAKVDQIVKGLADFQGIHRRFEYRLRTPEHVLIDDYAHHPTELRAAIATARFAHPGKHLTGIFQPHLYTRTRDNAAGFAEALSLLDRAILLPIYPARELPLPGVDSQMILEKMSLPARELVEVRGIFECLKKRPPEVLLVLGAGDIDRTVAPLVEFLSRP